MKEKELWGDELIATIEKCKEFYHGQCGISCPYKVKGSCRQYLMGQILKYIESQKAIEETQDKLIGLIQADRDRLQRKVAELREVNAGLALANLCDLPPNDDCLTENEFEVARKKIAEQKVEIERLNEEKLRLIGRNAGLCYSNNQLKQKIVDIKKQAVKDTAKEIYDFAKRFFEWDEEGFVSSLKSALYEHYGVEVE